MAEKNKTGNRRNTHWGETAPRYLAGQDWLPGGFVRR